MEAIIVVGVPFMATECVIFSESSRVAESTAVEPVGLAASVFAPMSTMVLRYSGNRA